MPTPAFYAQPFPTEAEADRHAARERVKSTLELLRGEAERPSLPLPEVLMHLGEAAEWVRRVRGPGSAEMTAALAALRCEAESWRVIYVLTTLSRCDRAFAAWAAEVGE